MKTTVKTSEKNKHRSNQYIEKITAVSIWPFHIRIFKSLRGAHQMNQDKVPDSWNLEGADRPVFGAMSECNKGPNYEADSSPS